MRAISERVRRIAAVIGSIVVLGVILWIDIATGLWQDLVVLAGVAAGLVTFVLTVLVLDRLVARSTARRWAPVTRLALTELQRVMADEEKSEISRGDIRPRLLPRPPTTDADLSQWLHELRELVMRERSQLANVLGMWSSFLASSSDNEDLLIRIADIALQLDRVRDVSLEVEEGGSDGDLSHLTHEITTCNDHFTGLVDAIETRLDTTVQPLIQRR